MNRIFGAVALGLAVTMGGLVTAQTEVRLSVLEPAGGVPTLAPVLKKASPAVVSITLKVHSPQAQQSAINDSRRSGRSPGPEVHPKETRAGSGVVLDGPRGLIITNNHVIEHADEMTVTLFGGRELDAKLVGADPDTDVAVIKVQSDNLTEIAFGDSDRLQAGDFVIVIGIPFPLGRTVTSGIVSGLHRSDVGIARSEDFIQTDAGIYPGDSGGALVNLRGELVGISTGYFGSSNTNFGIGFAIPINLARNVADQILKYGGVRRGVLGITFADPTPSLIRDMKSAAIGTGPVIEQVDGGSEAEHAGLKTGDVVTLIDGISVRNSDELHSRMGLYWLGDTVELTVLRAGQPIVIHAAMTETGQAQSK